LVLVIIWNLLLITYTIKKIVTTSLIAKSTIWLWFSEGKFPKPIKLSPRITIWEEEKVDNWMKEKL
jgi:prophage regulatory protein